MWNLMVLIIEKYSTQIVQIMAVLWHYGVNKNFLSIFTWKVLKCVGTKVGIENKYLPNAIKTVMMGAPFKVFSPTSPKLKSTNQPLDRSLT